jgi:hypothetical protein
MKMAKKIYYVKTKFQTYIELNSDYDADEKKEVLEAINYLPQCQFEFGIGESFVPLKGIGKHCQGKISSKDIGKLQEVTFEGWFCIDPKDWKNKIEEKIERLIKGESKFVFNNIRAGSFEFNAKNAKGKELENLPTEFEVTTTKPDGVDFIS